MFGCLCACFCCVSQLVLQCGSREKRGGDRGLSEVTHHECNLCPVYAHWEKIIAFFPRWEFVSTLMCMGGVAKQEVPGQLRLCPTSADHNSPPFILVMRMALHACVTVWLSSAMKIPHVAHQTWLTLAVVTTHCSSWFEGLLRLHSYKHSHTYKDCGENKRTNVSPFLHLLGDTMSSWTFQTCTLKPQSDNSNFPLHFSPKRDKNAEKTYPKTQL